MSTDRVVADRYALIRPIGRGAAAVVYAAKDRRRDKHVAVKVLPARPHLRDAEVQRFAAEAQAPARMNDAGILPVLDAGLDRDRDLFLVSPLLHGQTLRDMLKRGDAVPLATKLDVLDGAVAPLAVAHTQGFVHSNLTGSNVFVSRRRKGGDTVVLLDLGLAKLLSAEAYAAPGLRVSSPLAMAPELLSGTAPPSPSTDVWAFGVLLYECLTGRRPFSHEHPQALLHNVCHQEHEPADEVNPEVNDSMARLVDICLEKDPRRRPPDARALMRLYKSLRAGFGGMRAGRGGAVPLDTVLDTSGAAPPPPPESLEVALRRNPRDPNTHRALRAHYEEEGVADGMWLSASALDFLGQATREEIKLHHLHRRPHDKPFERGLDAGGWAALLHPDQDPRVDAVWAEMLPAVEKLLHKTDEELKLHRARRLDLGRPTSDLPRVYARAITAIRPGTLPRLYIGRSGVPPRHIPSTPPSSVFPKGFEEPLPLGALAFAVGRHTAYFRAAHRVCTILHEPEALEAMFDAGLRIGLGWAPETPQQADLAEQLSEQMSEGRREAVRAVCARLGTSARRVDLGTWRRAVELSCCRAGAVLSADLEGAAWMLRWTRERQHIPLEDAVDDLLSFWTSGAHVRIRHLLGNHVTTK